MVCALVNWEVRWNRKPGAFHTPAAKAKRRQTVGIITSGHGRFSVVIGGRESRVDVGAAIFLFLATLTAYLSLLATVLFAAYPIHVYIYRHISMYVR
jgi:hypothetical protein